VRHVKRPPSSGSIVFKYTPCRSKKHGGCKCNGGKRHGGYWLVTYIRKADQAEHGGKKHHWKYLGSSPPAGYRLESYIRTNKKGKQVMKYRVVAKYDPETMADLHEMINNR